MTVHSEHRGPATHDSPRLSPYLSAVRMSHPFFLCLSACLVLLVGLSLGGCPTDPIDNTWCEASAPDIDPAEVTNATVGEAYSQQFTAFGEGETWSVHDGELPPGLSLSEDGLLEGTPTTEGEYSFVLGSNPPDRETECIVQPASAPYTLTVDPEIAMG